MSGPQGKLILGLDIGTSSVGWVLIGANPLPEAIVAAGVRIFPEGMDRSRGEKSLNQDRRLARQLRRQTFRRVRRKAKLLNALQEIDLLPTKTTELHAVFQNTNPYAARATALDGALAPYELGRALYHLGQRRGYLSNRKTGSEKDGAVAAGIGELQQSMEQAGARTLGEYFYLRLQTFANVAERLRGNYTSRRMYLDEFEQIWQSQLPHHPQLLTKANYKRIHHAIFYQRPLRIQKHLIGWCEFEKDRKRAAAATLVAQEFRLWQTLNHLKIHYANGTERFLTDKERLKLHKKLTVSQKVTWTNIRKEIGGLLESDEFNLQKVRKNDLQGNVTQALLRNAYGKKAWDALTERQREQMVFDLLNIEHEEALHRRLCKHWQCDEDTAQKVMNAGLKLPKGVMHLSHKAMRNIVAHLSHAATSNDCGLKYNEACELAGYHHTQKIEHKGVDVLPLPLQDLRNPLVERALFQVRQVVNAIIREYGKPDIIRVEMARDLKETAKRREETQKRNRQNEARNEEAEKFLQEFGYSNPSRTDKLKYRLWKECREICPFSGQSISAAALFGNHPTFQIEHIIPYSRCMNDSFENKTLCADKINAAKGKQTPYEFFQGRPKDYESLQQRLKHTRMSFRKRQRFMNTEVPDALGVDSEFVSQQLNETRYIAKKTVEYLQQLAVKIEPVKGGTTAILRHSWGLNHILGDGEKTRLDHRHHAVDAIVIALTNVSAVHQLSRHHSMSNGRLKFPDLPCPMTDLRQQAQTVIDNIIVSHKPSRKIRGVLHDDTLYGGTDQSEKAVPVVVVRKPLEGLKATDLERIRDPQIRKLALAHLEKHAGNYAKAFKNPDEPFGMTTKAGGFVPIRKVRLTYARSVTPIGQPLSNKNDKQRLVWTRGNHHAEIVAYEDAKGKTKWEVIVVNLLEAYRRISAKEPVIKRHHGEGKRFVMSLHANDMLYINHEDQRIAVRVQKFDQNGNLIFRLHTDADKTNWKKEIRKKGSSFKVAEPVKVAINQLGRTVQAND